ncbi:hypothetical protein LVJ94_35395 [Pendulispora rubella]|uniref:Uncharacterized protein n=1 Tax=Pendulispora rubella TaxID=2741070 RepID=A0ABZ2KY01_9BACT
MLLQRVASTVIVDKLAYPARTDFEVRDGKVCIRYLPNDDVFTIHPHALAQLAEKAGLPPSFALKRARGEEWEKQLVCTNLNTLFQRTQFLTSEGEPTRFLHRIIGKELRGFLTRRFKRHLASIPLLRAFVEACRKSCAEPVEAISTDIRFSLKAFLPQVFQAFPGQYVCVGVEWANSDFGAGKLLISQTVWDPLRDTHAVLDHKISRVHLGSIIEESDLEISSETAAKEVDALAHATRDMVLKLLNEETIERLLHGIQVAHEHQLSWRQLRRQLALFLARKEIAHVEDLLTSDGVVDLPPAGQDENGERVPTRWWASNAIGYLAKRTADPGRKLELQYEAGKLLKGLTQGDAE